MVVVEVKKKQKAAEALRRARAKLAVLAMQLKSVREGRHRISARAIDAEIEAVRKKRSRA